MSGGYKILEHTADLGLQVWGKTPEELFAEAAQAMMALCVDPKSVTEQEACPLRIEADSLEETLHVLLREILAEMQAKAWVFRRLQIEKTNISKNGEKTYFLESKLWGEPVDLKRHDICLEIKAVTRHNFYIKRNNPWWEASILFDV
ncbi:archease [bacterium]|nr:archease [bacterium]